MTSPSLGKERFASEVLILDHEAKWDWPNDRKVLQAFATWYDFLKELLLERC